VQPRIVGAARGARWLGEGWRLFRVAPLAWLALVFAYWLLMTVISLVPVLGAAAAAVLVPAFSVGFMAAARSCAAGRSPEIGLLAAGFRDNLRVQLALGALYLTCLALVLAATALVDGGALARWMLAGEPPGEEALGSGAFLAALAAAAALYTPVMMAFWFGPLLAAWHASGAAKALFFSFFACLINWRAFLAYGAVTAAVMLVLPFVVLAALTLVSGGSLAVPAMALALPLVIVLLPTLLASFYASYRGIFGDDAGA
jgi:hypothetical protein